MEPRWLFYSLFISGVILRCCLAAGKLKTGLARCSKYHAEQLIDCSNRGFKHIPLEVLNMRFKNNVKLGGNPYICDCSITKFIRSPNFMSYAERILDPFEIKCSQPSKLKGKLMTQLRDKKDFCPEKKQKESKLVKGEPPSLKNCKADMTSLDCSNVGFEKPPPGIFDTGHQFIQLGKNPYVCDCNMTWFVSRLNSGDFKALIDDQFDIICAKPENLAGVSILDIIEDKISLCPKIDIDECANNTHNCSKDARCVNTVNGYTCHCKEGFAKYDGGRICVKKASCNEKPCSPLSEECVQQGPFFRCNCKKGFHKVNAKEKCEDIDECHNKEPCQMNAKCKNIYGSYRCDCKTGFSGDGKHCSDINECATGDHHCHKDASCLNTNGGYKCHCKKGLTEYNEGKLCVQPGKEKSSMTTILPVLVAAASLILSIGVVCVLCKRKRSKSKANELDIEKERQLSLLKDKEKLQEQLFLFNGCFNDMPAGIPPHESTITEWSEDENFDEDNEDDDDEFN